MSKNPTLAETNLFGVDYSTALLPENFQIYCYKCNLIMTPGTLVKKYDAATYTHEVCPHLAHKTFAIHKYGDAR